MNELIESIRAVVGDRGLLLGDDLRARATSVMDSQPHRGIALVRPASTEELSQVMRLCHAAQQPVAVQGGMTGLVEGADCGPGEIAVSLERMNAIESVDVANGTLVAQAGTPIQTVQERATAEGKLFAVDWGARGTATVGGGISTNAGGNGVVRYGMMRDQVLGLEAVLADGTVVSSMNHLIKNNTGYELKHLFIGSEGTLGIVTRAVLRLRPAPVSCNTAFLAVDSLEQVARLLRELEARLAGTLSAFEVMWQDFYQLILTHGKHQAPLPDSYPYYVLVEAEGADQDTDSVRFAAVLETLLEREVIVDATVATTLAQGDALWAIRDDIGTLFMATWPAVAFDVSVPIPAMEPYIESMTRAVMAGIPDARRVVFGHLGDGNLHLDWTTGRNDPAEQAFIVKTVYDELKPWGGSISAEHGIGLQKKNYLDRSRNATEIEWMHRLKQLFDPANILNPGRIL